MATKAGRRSAGDPSFPTMILGGHPLNAPALDPKAEESFRPPDDWKPETELAENVSIAPSRLSEVLRIAHVAKRGMKYSPEKPIRVEMQDGMIAVRFPSGAPPGGRRLRWSVHVLLDAETLRPITVYQDPN